ILTHDVDEAVLLSDRIVMLTNGPAATIGEILNNTLARPRNRVELANDTSYLTARAAVVDFLHRRHSNPASAPPAIASANNTPSSTPLERSRSSVNSVDASNATIPLRAA